MMLDNSITVASTEATSEKGIYITSLIAENLGTFYGLPITNTLLTSWAVILVLITLSFFVGRSIKMVPGKVQSIFESMIGFIYKFIKDTLEDAKVARAILPFILTLFLFIAASNILEFTPGIGSIGIWQDDKLIPFFRSVNTDLNVTLALAIMAVATIEFTGIRKLGFRTYGSKFINFSSPIKFFVGIIELASNAVRIVSFSFRLFGNIIAGKILIAVVIFFVPYILPSAVISFKLFIGIVQAGIFAILTLFFIKLAIAKPH